MPRNGVLLLSDYPHDMVGIECLKCNRRGRFSKARLMEKYGDIDLPDLRKELATNCTGKSLNFPCSARYTGMESFLPKR